MARLCIVCRQLAGPAGAWLGTCCRSCNPSVRPAGPASGAMPGRCPSLAAALCNSCMPVTYGRYHDITPSLLRLSRGQLGACRCLYASAALHNMAWSGRGPRASSECGVAAVRWPYRAMWHELRGFSLTKCTICWRARSAANGGGPEWPDNPGPAGPAHDHPQCHSRGTHAR